MYQDFDRAAQHAVDMALDSRAAGLKCEPGVAVRVRPNADEYHPVLLPSKEPKYVPTPGAGTSAGYWVYPVQKRKDGDRVRSPEFKTVTNEVT